jgi:hypothetical protein
LIAARRRLPIQAKKKGEIAGRENIFAQGSRIIRPAFRLSLRRSECVRGTNMQNYLFIGGNQDGRNNPVPPDLESVEMAVHITDKEIYVRDTLVVGNVSIAIYRHESLTSAQVLNLFVKHYQAWCAHRPGGSRRSQP